MESVQVLWFSTAQVSWEMRDACSFAYLFVLQTNDVPNTILGPTI